MTHLSATLGPPLGHRANFGLIVLRTDETIESDFRRLIGAAGVALYTTRIPCESEVTAPALARMEAALPQSAALLPHSLEYDVIGYGCTSGATVIGPQKVAAKIREGAKARFVTDPLTAVKAACDALNVKQLGFVTPYVADVSQAMRDALEADGRKIAAFASFEEESDERSARIDPNSITDAALHVAAAAPCDAIFVSCTNLRALEVIPALEARLGIPVIASNQALAWHMQWLGGIATQGRPFGRLMAASRP
ncbi:maleate cis-trans isomerase family protein [Actibacterium sp. D379-3]